MQSGSSSFAVLAALTLCFAELPACLLGQTSGYAQIKQIQEASTSLPAPATAKSPSPLDPAYRPMSELPRFNSNEPRLIPDGVELSRLKFQTPQWMQQFLSFPSEVELSRHVGNARPEVRKAATDAIAQIVKPQLLPADISQHLIPLSGWAVLYEDWRNHGGTDVFLTKFVQGSCAVELAETHNHVIVLVRDMSAGKTEDHANMLQIVHKTANTFFNEHFKPVSAEALKLFRESTSPPYIYGFYTPKIEALTGADDVRDLMTTGGQPNENSVSAKASAVRYFCNGEVAGFMILKPTFGAELRNPFEPRFTQSRVSTIDDVPFWENQAAVQGMATERTKRRQIEEYLGNYFYDDQGGKLTSTISVAELEKSFIELSPEQKLAIVERKMSDELQTSATRAFASADYTLALYYWTRLLDLEPENPRASILILTAVRAFAASHSGGDVARARKSEKVVDQALDAVTRQQTKLSMREAGREQTLAHERAVVNYRTRALNFVSEGNFAEALKEWDKLLSIDPGNASALTFRDICDRRLKSGRNAP